MDNCMETLFSIKYLLKSACCCDFLPPILRRWVIASVTLLIKEENMTIAKITTQTL